MSTFMKTISLKDLAKGKMKRVMAGKTPVLLVNTDGEVTAFQADCTHEQAPLEEGQLKGKMLTCPWHEAHFDMKTGKVSGETDWATDLESYETKVEDGIIFVRI